MAILATADLLSRVLVVSALTAPQMSRSSHAIGKQRFKRGSWIIEQCQKSGALSIILSAPARVIMADGCAKELIPNTLGQEDDVSGIKLSNGKAHSLSVKAEVQTDAVLGQADLLHCPAENKPLAIMDHEAVDAFFGPFCKPRLHPPEGGSHVLNERRWPPP